MTIGERREELGRLPISKLRRKFRKVWGNTDWVDRRKRADLIQAIINFEVGGGSTS